MSNWKLGRMLVDDQGFSKGDLVAVKRNDDLASYFCVPNFTVFRPKVRAALFYTRESIPIYVSLEGGLSPGQLDAVEVRWPEVKKSLKQKWKDNDAS